MGPLPAVPTHKHMAICHLQFVAPHTSLAPPLTEAGEVRRGGGKEHLHKKQPHIDEWDPASAFHFQPPSSILLWLTGNPTNKHTSNPIPPETQPFSPATQGCVMHKSADIIKNECVKVGSWRLF